MKITEIYLLPSLIKMSSLGYYMLLEAMENSVIVMCKYNTHTHTHTHTHRTWENRGSFATTHPSALMTHPSALMCNAQSLLPVKTGKQGGG